MNELGLSRQTNRRKPAEGVHTELGHPTIVLVTACTKDRACWLACEEARRLLVVTWHEADAWLVGDYLLMPDHLHLLAAARDLSFSIEPWITYWKSQFSKSHTHDDWAWQSRTFHHRLRGHESYSQKWLYVQENPVRAGLAKELGQWPFQGTVYDLRW